MRLLKKLYWGESVSGLKRTVKYKIKYRKFAVGYYCIILPESPGCLLDIISSEQLKVKYMRRKPAVVVGIAGSRYEAMVLAGTIVYDVYKATGGFDTRTYFCGRQRKKGADR